MASEKSSALVGVIGGSGVYDIDGLTDVSWRAIASPFGAPSDELCFAKLDGQPLVFLPRHGRGHVLPPSEINFRANIDALKRSGVSQIISLSAVGSFREDLAPGSFVIVDQFIDRTVARPASFFGAGLAAHVSMAHPVCSRLGDYLEKSCRALDIPTHRGGTYIAIEGPQFSSLAESNLYRGWGCDVIGMTNLPEARLAREAEMCYATVAMVTDYDCWHPEHDNVSVETIIRVLTANADAARGLVRAVAPTLADHLAPCPAGCDRALDNAIITAPEAREPSMIERLDAVAGRVLKS